MKAKGRLAMKKKTEYINVDTKILDKTIKQLNFLAELASKLLVVAISDSISDEDYKKADEVLANAKEYDSASVMVAFAIHLRGFSKRMLGKDASFLEYLEYKKKGDKS
jgi:acyl-CoA synthetase (NDP forming)